MKKIISLFVILTLIVKHEVNAQVFCVQCFHQNEPVAPNAGNLLLNGSFESSNCNFPQNQICPNSVNYSCDIHNWTSYGGGTFTYAQLTDSSLTRIPDGLRAIYFGNSFSKSCSSNYDDTLCLVLDGCRVSGIPLGYPLSDPPNGSDTGISIFQDVTGLTIGQKYALEFWAGGEKINSFFTASGLFAVNIGSGNIFLRDLPTAPGDTGTVFLIGFEAISTTQRIKFTNWGHCCSSCTELILDNVRLYEYSELPPFVPDCTVGINNSMNYGRITIVPNPATSELRLQPVSDNERSFIFFDLSSREILNLKIKGNEVIDVKNIAVGIYFYRVIENGKIITEGKFLKTSE